MQRHFERSVDTSSKGLPLSDWNIETGKMMKLPSKVFSSSALYFTIYVSLAHCGIVIFEFSCKEGKLEVCTHWSVALKWRDRAD